MSILNIRKTVEERIFQLNYLITEEEKRLRNAPQGRIKIAHRNDSKRYYLVNEQGTEYLSDSERQLIRSLIQKNYNQKILNKAKQEKAILDRLMKSYPSVIAEEVYSELSPDRQQLISPIILPDDEYIKIWENKPFTPKPFGPNDPEYYSNKGERVRSKSEKIIADRLFARNVPYRYECPLDVPELGTIHPDFTILNVNKRQEMYLEHCGKMDDPQYANNLVRRNNCYSKCGIILGDSLFMSFESERYPLDTRTIDKLIDQIISP